MVTVLTFFYSVLPSAEGVIGIQVAPASTKVNGYDFDFYPACHPAYLPGFPGERPVVCHS